MNDPSASPAPSPPPTASPSSPAVRWHPRGIGLDQTPGCLACPDSPDGLYGNLAAFVATKADGEAVVAMFAHGARLDWREYEPEWIQVKVGACHRHQVLLERLREQWFVAADEVARLVTHHQLRDELDAERAALEAERA
jgi:hypothetical protein